MNLTMYLVTLILSCEGRCRLVADEEALKQQHHKQPTDKFRHLQKPELCLDGFKCLIEDAFDNYKT